MADEIATFPFDIEEFLTATAQSELTGDGYKFTIEDEANETENTFEWEERYSDLDLTVSQHTYSQPFEAADLSSSDGELGDLAETDHDRPPLGSFVFGPAFDGTCFAIKDNLLHYCKAKQPEYWPALFFVEVSARQRPGVMGLLHQGQVYYFTKSEMFYLQGTGHGAFLPLPLKCRTGVQSVRGALSVSGKGIYHTGPDGIYLYSSGSDSKITEDALEPIFRGETVNGLPGVSDMSTSWLHEYRNHLYFGYQSEGFDYPTNLLVMNLETGQVVYYTYDDGDPVEISAVATDDENSRLLVGGDGFIRVIEDSDATDDSGEPISWEVQSKDFMLQTRRHFPRWVKYDIDASEADSCTGELLLAGTVLTSHTITGDRDTRRRLVGTGNGTRAAIRLSGTGAVSIYAVEGE